MGIVDHGVWIRYVPETISEKMPVGAVFLKRTSDNVDWYDYVRPSLRKMQRKKPKEQNPEGGEIADQEQLREIAFQPGSVMCNVYHHPDLGVNIVGTAVYDPTMMFPENQRVIEITDYRGNGELHKDFGGKMYDHESKTFGEPPKHKPQPTPFEERVTRLLDTLVERLDKLEKK